jgi:hypothetical protein
MRHVSRELTLDAAISGPLLVAWTSSCPVPAPDRQATIATGQSEKVAGDFATVWLHAAAPKAAWYTSACLTGSPDCNLCGEFLNRWLPPIRSTYRVLHPLPQRGSFFF